MADIGEKLINWQLSNSRLTVKRSKLPFRKAKGVRREPEKIELFLAEKEHLASIKNRFLPLEPCCSRTLIVRLERIDDLIKKYKEKKESNNGETACTVLPRKTNNETEDNAIFTNEVCSENLSKEDIPIQQSSSQVESEKNFCIDNDRVSASCASKYPMKQLDEYAYNFWTVDCIVCKKKFPDQLELHKHATLSHPGMQISFCDVCGKPFFGKKSLCQHITSEHQATPWESPIKSTKTNDKNEVTINNLAKKKSFSLNSKTQNKTRTLNELTNSKGNSMFENHLPNSSKTQNKKYTLRHNRSELNTNLFETVIRDSLNLLDECEGENSNCNRRTTRSEVKALNESNKMRTLRKRKTSSAEFNGIDNDIEIIMEKTVQRKGQKRRKVENSATIAIENDSKIAKKKNQAENISLENEIDVVPEKEKFNYSCVKSETKTPIPLIKMEEQITDWFPEDFTTGKIDEERSGQSDSLKEKPAVTSPIQINRKAITPIKELKESFNKELLDVTSLESKNDTSNEIPRINQEENEDMQGVDSLNYIKETNIILPEEMHTLPSHRKDENCSIIDEIIVIQLKSDDSKMKESSEVSQDNVVCRDFIEKSRSSTHREEILNCDTETEQDQNEIEEVVISIETSKRYEVKPMDEVECICLEENEKPEVEIIEENSRNDFEKTKSGECVIMEPIEDNRKRIPEEDQIEQNIFNDLENTDSTECVIVEPTEDKRDKIPEEVKQNAADNFGNTDSSECVILEATRETGEKIPENDAVEQNISNNLESNDSSKRSIVEATEDRREENPEENQIDHDISNDIEQPVLPEDREEKIPEETQIEQNDTTNNIESEDLEKNSQSENNASNASVTDTQTENNSEEHETDSNKCGQLDENIELNMSDKSDDVMDNESGSNVEDNFSPMVTRGILKIVDQSILIPPAFSTTWTCTDCSTSFDEYLNLLLHKTEMHRYACTECNKFFDSKSKFLVHMNALHPDRVRKELDHAADQARINEFMLRAYRLSKLKEPNNSVKKRKSNTDSKEKSSASPSKKPRTETKNKMVIDNFDSEEILSSRPVEENENDEVCKVVNDDSDKSDPREKLSAEPVKKDQKTQNDQEKNDTLIDNIDSEEKLSSEPAKENEVIEESNVVLDASGKSDSTKKAPAGFAKTNKKGKNVKKNKTVITNMNSKEKSSSKSSRKSKVEEDSNAMMDACGKNGSKKKKTAKPAKTIKRAKTVKKNKVVIIKGNSEQKSASDPVTEKIAEESRAIMVISEKTDSDSEKLSAVSAKLIEKIDSEKIAESDFMVGEKWENRVDKENKIVMDVLEETNSNEKSLMSPVEKNKSTKIDQENTTMTANIDCESNSLSRVDKVDKESKAAVDVSKEADPKEKAETKLIKKNKNKKSTKVTDVNKPDLKTKEPSKKFKPTKKSKTVQNNSKKTKKNNSKSNGKINKKNEGPKLSKKKVVQKDQGVSTRQHDLTSKKNLETVDNSIQKDAEAKSDDPTNSNFISEKENLNPESKANTPNKKSVEDSKTSWMCIKCQQHFLIRHEYILHSFYAHEDMTLISICDTCGEVLTSIESSKKHTCMEVLVLCCQTCSMEFTTGVEFVQHNRAHHLEMSVLHKCDTCPRTFLTESMLAKHEEGHDISKMITSKITTILRSDKKKSVKASSKKTSKISSRKMEQPVSEESVNASKKKKEKKVKSKKPVKATVKKPTKVSVKSVKSTGKKAVKAKRPTKLSTKKPAKVPIGKPSKALRKELTKKSTEESRKLPNERSKELSSEAPPEEAENKRKSKRKPKKPTEKLSKVSAEISLKPASNEAVKIVFKKPREYGPRSRKFLPPKFHFFNYQTFQSAFIKHQMPCLFCEDVFRTSAGYINHLLRTHHTSGEECQICRRTFVNETMIHHVLTAHAVPSDANKVSLKSKELLDSTNQDNDKPIHLDMNFIIKHMDKKRLFSLCQYHAFDHVLKNETFLCPWCNKVMEHPRHYRIHYLTVHDKTCVICNVEFEISQVAALHKSKVHGYVGSYLWFAEIIVRTLVNCKQYGANPKEIMIYMNDSDVPTCNETINNLTDGKVITDLNNSESSCNRSTSIKDPESDVFKNDKIMDLDTSIDCLTKNNDSFRNRECTATNDPQQDDSRNEKVTPPISDNCLTRKNNNANNLIPRINSSNQLSNLNKDNEILENLM